MLKQTFFLVPRTSVNLNIQIKTHGVSTLPPQHVCGADAARCAAQTPDPHSNLGRDYESA